jgi:hypothetical protein
MNDNVRLMKMRSECAGLWGAIECFKRGETPVIGTPTMGTALF